MLAVLAFVYLFLIRIKFPVNKSISCILRQRYGNNTLQQFRKTEKLNLKYSKALLDISFLKQCINNRIIPHFLRFKLANRSLQRTQAYRSCQLKLLRSELQFKQRKLRHLDLQRASAFSCLKSLTSSLDFNHLQCFILRANSKKLHIWEHSQNLKLLRLKQEQPQHLFSHSPDDVILNLSSRVLTPVEKSALAKGLDFSLPPKSLNYPEYLSAFEKCYRSLRIFPIFGNSTLSRIQSTLRETALSSFNKYNSSQVPSNMSQEEFRALTKLRKDKNIVVLKPDKGNGVVVMDKTSYLEKMDAIISDNTKFEKQDQVDIYELSIKLEDRLTRILRKLRLSKAIDQETYKQLVPSGSRPGILYGLPKTHKAAVPMRPILSAIGTFNYGLAKYIVKLLAPFTASEYCVINSFDFAKEISQFPNANSYIMASFDVTSLFTNIPLDETIEICLRNMYDKQDPRSPATPPTLDRNSMKCLLELAAKESYFLFDGRLYKQLDGVAMGSPLGPSFANIFMSYYESLWLSQCPSEFKPVLYRRYVDDTFLLFRSPQHIDSFLDYLNGRHPNIKFTSERESNNQISFLDILISRADGSFSTSTYRKPTYTGLYTLFSSFVPSKFKYNIVFVLFQRAARIASSLTSMHLDFSKLTHTLLRNGYPHTLIQSITKRVVEEVVTPTSKLSTATCAKKEVLLVLPFTGNHGLQVRKKLQEIFRQHFPQLALKVVFRPSFRIANLFRFKDRVPSHIRSLVVYNYTCCSCNATYIGKTSRHLHQRVSEHVGISSRTGKTLGAPPFSAIREHAITAGHPIDPLQFKIISSASHSLDLAIHEALLIQKEKPSLNIQGPSSELSLFT